jgi:hypothetical protein
VRRGRGNGQSTGGGGGKVAAAAAGGTLGAGWELPGGQPDPPPFIPGCHSGRIIWPNHPDNLAPTDILPQGADILAWEARTESLGIFQKQILF